MEQIAQNIAPPQGLTADNGFSSDLFDWKKSVKLYVRSEAFEVIINRDLLGRESSYFRDLFESDLDRSTPRQIRLLDIEKGTFEVFLYWIWHHKLSYKPEDGEWCLPLTKAWVVAQKMGTAELANAIIERMRVNSKNNNNIPCPSGSAVRYLWDQPKPYSKLKQMFLTLFPLFANPTMDMAEYPLEFLASAFQGWWKATKKEVKSKRKDFSSLSDLRKFHGISSPRENVRVRRETRNSRHTRQSQQSSSQRSTRSKTNRLLSNSQQERAARTKDSLDRPVQGLQH